MALKPLYLPHGHGIHVQPDGPALRVRARAAAACWYPFDRLSRVVSADDVRWHGGALLRCLTAGVPVSFLDRTGQPLGCCHGMLRRETTLEGLLLQAIEHPDWDENYRTWHHGMQRQAMRSALRANGLRCHRLESSTTRGLLANAYFRHTHCCAGRLFGHLQGVLFAWVGKRLGESVTTPELLEFPRPGLNFTAAMTETLQWPLQGLLVSSGAAEPDEDRQARFAAVWFQQHRNQIRVHYDELIRQFELWLRGWVL